ncbi:hypothetical protein Pa4123_40290 [Phytohabitans aurantiacus]|uniref:Uncharacterized protein n=1 Tax=Phytohabitans aurantiacus TaxID=3016789 RepID=A0ABQ5QWD8_9ACTN|nr:hypothetical protein Pa4123_40290 [Phytohabitans aurantiacus]
MSEVTVMTTAMLTYIAVTPRALLAPRAAPSPRCSLPALLPPRAAPSPRCSLPALLPPRALLAPFPPIKGKRT